MTQIFSTIHNGTPVYELSVEDVLVARRATDSFINAAHILQIAGLSLSKRTRIIQREILPGTLTPELAWIPLDHSIALCKKYRIYDQMKALLEYNPHNGIPKLKPLTTLIESLKRKYISDKSSIESYAESHDLNMIKNENESIKLPMIPQLTQTKKSKTDSHESNNLITTQNLSSEDCKFIILNIFIQSSHYTILHLLRNPQTREINVNLVIDKHGHSSIHYACQLGNIRLLKCLIEEGGDVLLGNYWGETGLIRSITTAANYDLRVFPETLALLSKSVFSVDLKRHTILHHLSFLGGQPKRVKQVTYYLQCLSASLCKSKLAILLGSKDRVGDTALHVACRMGAVKVIELLLKMGARRDTLNLAQVTPDECIDINSDAFRSLYPKGRQFLKKGNHLPSPVTSPQKEMKNIMTYLQNHFQRKAEEKVDTIHNFLSNELLAKDSLIKAQLYELSETKKKLTLERTLQTTLLADSHDIIQQSLKKQSLECGLENFGKTEENICFLGSDEVELGIRLESLNGKIEDIQKIEGGVYDELLSKVLECRVEDVEGIVKNVEPVL